LITEAKLRPLLPLEQVLVVNNMNETDDKRHKTDCLEITV